MILLIGVSLNDPGLKASALMTGKILLKSAFTLVEVLLVVVVLSVVAGIAIPNFSKTYKKINFRVAVDSLLDTMRYAQSRAIMKNNQVRVVFDYGSPVSFRLTQQPDVEDGDELGENQEYIFQRVQGRMGRTFVMPDDVIIEKGQDAILFYPDGQIEKQQFFVCQYEACYTVTTQLQRGQVNIFEGRLEDGNP